MAYGWEGCGQVRDVMTGGAGRFGRAGFGQARSGVPQRVGHRINFPAETINAPEARNLLLDSIRLLHDETLFLDDDFHFIGQPGFARNIEWDKPQFDLPAILAYLKKLFIETDLISPNDNLLLALLAFQKAACFESVLGNLTGLAVLEANTTYKLGTKKIFLTGNSDRNDKVQITYSQIIEGFESMFDDGLSYRHPAFLTVSYELTGGNGLAAIQLGAVKCELYASAEHHGATGMDLKTEIEAVWRETQKLMLPQPKMTLDDFKLKIASFYKTQNWTGPQLQNSIQSLSGILS